MRSKPVPATCDPNFDETFYFCLDQIQKQGKQSNVNVYTTRSKLHYLCKKSTFLQFNHPISRLTGSLLTCQSRLLLTVVRTSHAGHKHLLGKYY